MCCAGIAVSTAFRLNSVSFGRRIAEGIIFMSAFEELILIGIFCNFGDL